ncbi:preprotein translocase subunit YajC [Brochothrix campestris]|uniref:Preprotein translocase subunit YajC n=1 Tax=Brochothrix campestris FSL F6-1037 TaxID=1265861 RepID=W7CY75_9LIST|nr:preprotein translocase subunit YajC [Brochothrix campestris]EUJ41700.1 preprotein translocase subunit YajC [Brochothrix campestris FSL F6-1037]
MSSMLLIVVMIALFYFMLIRPQQKRQKKVQSMQSALKKGDTIATIGGLHGVVESIDEKQITLDCHGSLLTFDRQAVRTVLEVAEAPVETFESDDNN